MTYKLTSSQKNIWNLQKYYEETSISNICGAIFFEQKIESELLRKALNLFLQEQDAFRLRFHMEKGEICQVVSDYENEEFPVREFASWEEYVATVEKEKKILFQMEEGKMYRFMICQFAENTGVFTVLNHLVADAWTLGILASRLSEILSLWMAGDDAREKKNSYLFHIEREENYLQSDRFQKDRTYWQDIYAEKPEVAYIKPEREGNTGVAAKRFSATMEQTLTGNIRNFCRERNVTPAVLFEAALFLYLGKINTENHGITIGTPVLNRVGKQEKRIAGMFISTVPLTVTYHEDMCVLEFLKHVTERQGEVFRHQKYPYAKIQESLKERFRMQGNLYDVMVSYQNAQIQSEIPFHTEWYGNGYSEVALALHIDDRDKKGAFHITLDYQTDVFQDEKEIQFLYERILFILEQLISGEDKLLREISILPEKEYQRLLCTFNDTRVDYPREKCVHELFMEQVEKTPEKTALVFHDKKITYRELKDKVRDFILILKQHGVEPGDVLCIYLNRSEYIIYLQLAILSLNAVFVPIDSRYPIDRIKKIVDESDPKYIIISQEIKEKFRNILNVLILEEFQNEVSIYKKPKLEKVDCEQPAYIIYTSGSTGQPKGCVLTQKGLLNFCYNNNILEACNKLKNKVCVSVNTISFDYFIAESLLPLLNGFTVVLADEEQSVSKEKFAELVIQESVNIVMTTPTRYKLYLEREDCSYFSQFQIMVTSGERLDYDLLKKMVMFSSADIFNPLGPSECSVWNVGEKLEKKNENIYLPTDITIGKPIANTQIYILDRNQNPTPIGVPGELCIAGDGVGLGYLNRPDLTAERFVSNPFATEENHHGKTMYKTGDLAAWRSDGNILYLGRIDTQVKIRGLRIELGEIENVMSEFPGIRMCAVADKKDENGRQYLVGYYNTVSDEKEEQDIITAYHVDEKALRGYLLSKLPKYMVPNYFMHIKAFPMTASGKLDRKNLPVPIKQVEEDRVVCLPENETEEELLSVWQSLFGETEISTGDDFLDIGGDSLMAISLLSELEERFSVRLQMKDIFSEGTIQKLANRIESSSDSEILEDIEKSEGSGFVKPEHLERKKYIATNQQRMVYAYCMKNPKALTYNMPVVLPLSEKISRKRLADSLGVLVQKFPVFRTGFQMADGEIWGIEEESVELEIEEYREAEKGRFVRAFDISKAPLIRFAFTENALLIDMHHIITDGQSLNFILENLMAIYDGKTLLTEDYSYGDYADYIERLKNTERWNLGRKYFSETFSNTVEPLAFPEDGVLKEGEGKSYIAEIPLSVSLLCREICGKYKISETMLHMAAYGVLLKRYTNAECVTSSIILTNRVEQEFQKTMGMFVNTLPFQYLDLDDMAVNEYFEKVKEIALGLFEYQYMPLDVAAESMGVEELNRINTSFVYQANGISSFAWNGEEYVPQPMDTKSAKFDLTLEVIPVEEAFRLRFEYRMDKIGDDAIKRMAEAYISILEQFGEKKKIDDVSVLSKKGFQKIIYDFNDTRVDYPKEKCVHELFMEQVEKTPEQTALVFEERKFTYREIDEMSNSLAHLLRERGIGRGDIVPIISVRSYHIIVAMLGILKVGAAYMPVSPDYPKDRVDFILKEARCKEACVYGYEEEVENVVSINLGEVDYRQDVSKVENVNEAGDVCYVIFTSGSTGVPKGTVSRHRNVVNYCMEKSGNIVFQEVAKKSYKKILSVTNFIFDIFVTETLYPFVNGLTVYFTNDDECMKQLEINRIIVENKIDIMQTTPSRMKGYLIDGEKKEYLSVLKILILGGEALPLDLVSNIKKDGTLEIYNIYGPAETTVWSSNAHVDIGDITIGKPIANTQIYILDRNQNPTPIGVPGELCIAGDGVGLGYLNRPDLTAERFVPNPFATEENHHGKTMYKTGDLATWRSDGNILYLGRIDTQVKIRGLRIELGEIESVMSEFPGIRMCAVADKKDENGRQYLVGYYNTVSDEKEEQDIITAYHVDEKALREHLLSKLPKYMVPNYFMHIKTFPMTASGKLDRKNLPVPSHSILQEDDFIPPHTDMQKTLCRIAGEILEIENYGIHQDFFEHGGDSLSAIEFVVHAEKQGIPLKLQMVFDYPTIEELANAIVNGEKWQDDYSPERFLKYEKLFAGNRKKEYYHMPVQKVGTVLSVLLTGVTGFLGAHILDELLSDENCTVYCLVRNLSEDDRRGQISKILKYYFDEKYENEIGSRIIPVEGDITREDLSDELPEQVDLVIHSAASVKHFGKYEYFYQVNTLGTKNVARYAKNTGAKFVYISTISVSGNSFGDSFDSEIAEEERFFDEASLYQGQKLENVYVRSKFEAECMVLDYMLEGLQANIIRVGNLTNRSGDYRFQPNYTENAFLSRVKAALDFGYLPDYLLPLYSEFSPVNDTAKAVVKIAKHFNQEYTVFHVNSDRRLYFHRLVEILKELQIPMEVVSGDRFIKKLREMMATEQSYIYEAFINDLDQSGKLAYDSNIRIENDFTLSYLKELGFEWTEIDLEYVKGYVEWFRELEYFR